MSENVKIHARQAVGNYIDESGNIPEENIEGLIFSISVICEMYKNKEL